MMRGDNFKYVPIIVFLWYFLLPPDPSLCFQWFHHMASIASRKGGESKSREKVIVSQSPGPRISFEKTQEAGAIFVHIGSKSQPAFLRLDRSSPGVEMLQRSI